MANIFDGFKNAPDDQIADQIALLETITMGKVLSVFGNKAKLTTVKSINWITNVLGKKEYFEEPEVKEVQELVAEKKTHLAKLSRGDLDRRLKEVIRHRSDSNRDASEEMITVNTVEKAYKIFRDIYEDLTPEQKADSIYNKFHERILNNIQNELKKQNKKQADKMSEELDSQIASMSLEQRQKIQEMLKVETLTGQSMRETLLKAGTPALLISVASTAGFGSFVALTTIIHAVFTTMLGITLPFAVYTGASSLVAFITGPVGWLALLGIGSWQMLRGSDKIDQEMLAQNVWFAVASNGRYLSPADDELPSWVPKINRISIDEEDRRFLNLMAERDAAFSQVNSTESMLHNVNQQMATLSAQLEAEKKRRKNAEEQKEHYFKAQSKIKKQLFDAQDNVENLQINLLQALTNAEEVEHTRRQLASEMTKVDELQKKLNQTNDLYDEQEQLLKYASSQIEGYEAQNLQLVNENKDLVNRNKALAEDAEVKATLYEKEAGKRHKEIAEKWSIHFEHLIIPPKVARQVAKLNLDNKLIVERELKIMNDAEDAQSLPGNRGKLHGTEHSHRGFKLEGGIPARFEFKILKNRKEKIEIVTFYDHSTSNYMK